MADYLSTSGEPCGDCDRVDADKDDGQSGNSIQPEQLKKLIGARVGWLPNLIFAPQT